MSASCYPWNMSLDVLNTRRSTPARQLGAPGPSPEQLDGLLAAAIRAPDHGKLTPLRLLLIRGDARRTFGETLAQIHQRNDPTIAEAQLLKDRERYTFAPLVVVVVARITPQHKTPTQEEVLAAGCVADMLLLGAQALGFGAQWLAGWAAYDADVAALLGLCAHERVVAFVHIGTVHETAPERTRPPTSEIVGEWRPA